MTADPDPEADPDPVLEARIQHALAPYRDRLTPAGLAEARRMLTVLLTTHPVLSPLMERVRQGTKAAPETSGVAPKDDAAGSAAPVAPPARRKKEKKGSP
jgi:hypothetical protein